MEFVQFLPFASIMLCLAAGALCAVLSGQAARRLALCVLTLGAAGWAAALYDLTRRTEGYFFRLGRFPAPWGAELLIDRPAALFACMMLLVTALVLLAGTGRARPAAAGAKKPPGEVSAGKASAAAGGKEREAGIFFAILCLLSASLQGMICSDDLFTGYVFAELTAIAAAAAMAVQGRKGQLLSSVRFLVSTLAGSGLLLAGLGILYQITGRLSMPECGAALQALTASGEYGFTPELCAALIMTGIAAKAALFPFHAWLPDAAGTSSGTLGAVLTGLVPGGYILLLSRVIRRGIGMPLLSASRICVILPVLSVCTLAAGLIRAQKEESIIRLTGLCVLVQTGYACLAAGLDTAYGSAAAYTQILAGFITLPLMMMGAEKLVAASGGRRDPEGLRGAGRRCPAAGLAFAVGALSMIALPLLAGFTARDHLAHALALTEWKSLPIPSEWGLAVTPGSMILLAVLTAAVILCGMCCLPYVMVLFAGTVDGSPSRTREPGQPGLTAAVLILVILQLLAGCCGSQITEWFLM